MSDRRPGDDPLYDRALQATADIADLLSEVLRDSAIPRDWWLRATAMELAIQHPMAGTFGDHYVVRRAKQFEQYIQTGEWTDA